MNDSQIGLITGSVDFLAIIGGVGAVAGACVLVLVAIKGALILRGMIRGDYD